MNLLKPTKVRSKTLTRSAHGERCTLRVSPDCDDHATIVFCHAPSNGKGVSTKSDDFWGAYGCVHCHALADKGDIEPEDWLRAIYETMKRFFERELLIVND